jgi:hypothetical protein
MKSQLDLDMERLESRAYERAEWAEGALRRYHAARLTLKEPVESQLRLLYDWMFVPATVWPFNVQDVLEDCLTTLEKGKRLNPRQRLLIELLPEPPDETVCATVAEHEHHVQSGIYEDLVTTPAKFAQKELIIQADPQLHRDWGRLKSEFNVQAYADHKGVIPRTMATERNLRPRFFVNPRRRGDVFQAAFDAFCLRWNLYGMQNDTPLVLKLAVNITPFGTLILIPAYWSLDPKRDIRWDAIANLHRARVPTRQGPALAAGFVQRTKDAKKLLRLDQAVLRLGLKGPKRHEYLCAGLGWTPGTSPKRISRLRAEFKSQQTAKRTP